MFHDLHLYHETLTILRIEYSASFIFCRSQQCKKAIIEKKIIRIFFFLLCHLNYFSNNCSSLSLSVSSLIIIYMLLSLKKTKNSINLQHLCLMDIKKKMFCFLIYIYIHTHIYMLPFPCKILKITSCNRSK